MIESQGESPRWKAVVAHAQELIDIGGAHGARDIAICGSVARGTDTSQSDIDFLVGEFDGGDGPERRREADTLVERFREVLRPYKVDVRPLPGWLLGPEYQESMVRDAIPLSHLVVSFGSADRSPS